MENIREVASSFKEFADKLRQLGDGSHLSDAERKAVVEQVIAKSKPVFDCIQAEIWNGTILQSERGRRALQEFFEDVERIVASIPPAA